MSDPGSLYDGEDEDLSMLVPEMRAEYARLKNSERAANAAMEKNVYGPQRAMWDQYRKDLEQRRAGPSAAENLLSLGAALAQPTKYRGFSGMLANVAPVLAEQQKASRAAEDAKRELLMKYGMETKKVDLAQKQAEIQGSTNLAQKRFDALKTLYTPKLVQTLDPVTNQLVWRMVTPAEMYKEQSGGDAVISDAPAAGNVAHPKNQKEYDALPKGAYYIAPNGTTQRKQ